MIRRATMVWFTLAAIAGYAMYHLKYEVIALEDELAARNSEILTYQEGLHVLRAEWAYLNEPSRLQQLAERYLDLRPLTPADEVEVSALLVRGGPESPAATIPTPRLKPTWAAASIARRTD
jgi:hypothetical protein